MKVGLIRGSRRDDTGRCRRSLALCCVWILLTGPGVLAQPAAERERAIELRRISIERVAARQPDLQLRPSMARHLKVRVRSNIVGDADGDGLFDTEDARFLRDLLSHRRIVLDRGQRPLADVAYPCGNLTPADLRLLIAALRAQPTGYRLDSQCHFRQAIGTPLVPEPRAPRTPYTIDDQFADVAEQVPEFGGLYYDEDVLKVVLTDTDDAVFRRAVRAITTVFGKDLPPPESIEPVQGTFQFTELRAWKGRAGPTLSMDEVTSLDVDERRNTVTVGIQDMADRDAVEQLLTERGIPAEAIYFKHRGVFTVDNHQLIPQLQGATRPLRGGLAAGVAGSSAGSGGTIGFLTWRGGEIGFVTNEHVTTNAGSVGDSWSQPAQNAADAVETADAGTFTGGACPSGCTCTWADASFFRLNPGATGRIGLIAKSSHYWPHSLASRVSVKGGTLACGNTAHWTGSMSGHQEGTVVETCCDVDADWSGVGNSPNVVTQLCQTIVEGGSRQSGDSGGPMYRPHWGFIEVSLHGIYWGSIGEERAFAPMANIEAELGFLHPEYWNEKPTPTITSPQQDEVVGSGAFPIITAKADYFDFEDGTCPSGNCEIKWIVAYGGGLIGTTPVIDGKAEIEFMLGNPGKHLLIAVATDTNGALGPDWVEFSTGNSVPQVWIEWPPNGQQVYQGFTYQVQGNSFDNELFHALNCNVMNWNFPAASSPGSASGCTAQVVFNGLGQKTITLTGTDPGGKSATAQATINVVNAPANTGPVVTWITPAQDSGLARDQVATLTVRGNDPDDKSPISYAWYVNGSMLVGNPGQINIGNTSGPDNANTSTTWTPSDDVMTNCGGTPVQLQVIATDADGDTGSATRDVVIAFPPC